jgi:precorrin-2 dehydrogenase / sirohydrochlorin ferrochelatase
MFQKVSDKPCIVVGGGKVAERKVRLLLKFHAKVKVISPKIIKSLAELWKNERIAVVERRYMEGDLADAALVFAATNDEAVNSLVHREASVRQIPINVADNPDFCDFIVPSVVKKGPISVAISTSGTLPLLSKKLRKEIERLITADYVKYASLLGEFRQILIETIKDKKKRDVIMKEIGKMDIYQLASMHLDDLKKRYLSVS